MDMEPRKLETLDDLRAAMNDPEIQAANKEFSKKYLKANRPRSVFLVVVALVALFFFISVSSHKASSVTPSALRLDHEVTWSEGSLSSEAPQAGTLTDQQRTDLLALLDTVKVQRLSADDAGELTSPFISFAVSDESFTLTRSGHLVTKNNTYTFSDSEAVWEQLSAILALS